MTFDPTAARARLDALTGYTPGPWEIRSMERWEGRSTVRYHEIWDGDYNIIVEEATRTHLDGGFPNIRLIAAAPDLATDLRAALDANERLIAENARLRAFIADFASNDFERIRSRPVSGHPADEEDDVTPLGTVQAWQDDARAALEGQP